MPSPRELEAITASAGLADRSLRARLEVSGPDRAKFLHNLTTNEVKRLPAGRGCEAFVTSPQGKTIGYVVLHAGETSIWVRTDPGGLELVLPHLRKYGVFDDVTIDDRTADTFEFHVCGPEAASMVQRAAGGLPGENDYAHATGQVAEASVLVIRESPAGLPGFSLIGVKASAQACGKPCSSTRPRLAR